MKYILTILCLIFSATITAQDFTLQGRVMDKDNKPIEFASVVSQGKMAMTNLKGEYSIQLKSEDSVVVNFSMVGYKAKKRVLRNPKGKQTLQIQLLENTELNELMVVHEKRQTTQTQKLNIKDTQRGPSSGGNAVEELIQQQAGVSTHNELSSQYNVRGGSFDENSVYINDIEVYRPFLVRSGQQEGLSIINSDMVDQISFSTGGFEARYGDKMSSALSILYKKPKPFEATVTASLLGGSAYLGLANKVLAWQNGLRYKTNKILLGTLQEKGEYNPNFFDYQTHLVYSPSKRIELGFLGDVSINHYNFTPESRETSFGTQENVKSFKVYFDGKEKDIFRTYFGAVHLKYNIKPNNTYLKLLASAFQTKEQETYDIQGQYWLTQTETSENLGVGTYMEHARNYLTANVKNLGVDFYHKAKKHEVLSGVRYKIERISEKNKEYEMRDSAGYTMPHTGEDLNMIYTLNSKNSLRANRLESYIQDTYKFNNTAETTFYTLCYGIRFSHWNFNKESLISPRASLAVVPSFNDNITLRFATGLYYQAPFYKELRDTSTIEGVTYATLNQKIKSQRSLHFIAAMDYRFKISGRPFKFSSEAYYKTLSDLIPYSVNNVKVVYDASQKATGNILGFDMKLYGEFVPGTDSWISLSLMKTKMNLNEKSLPMPSDQRYSINMFFTDYFPGTDLWKMSLKLAFADGLPFGAPHRALTDVPFRAPAYKRADIGMQYRAYNNVEKKQKNILRNIWLGIDCLNILGISNVNSYYWVTDVTNHQYAVPNYLTGRQANFKITVEM